MSDAKFVDIYHPCNPLILTRVAAESEDLTDGSSPTQVKVQLDRERDSTWCIIQLMINTLTSLVPLTGRFRPYTGPAGGSIKETSGVLWQIASCFQGQPLQLTAVMVLLLLTSGQTNIFLIYQLPVSNRSQSWNNVSGHNKQAERIFITKPCSLPHEKLR